MQKHHARLHSRPHIRGDLEIIVANAVSRREIRRILKRNTITYDGLNSSLYLWAQNAGITVEDYQIVKLVPGTNGTPPTRGDPGLGAPLATPDHIILTDADRLVSPTTGELIITGTLLSGQGNTAPGPLVEIGLVLGNGQPFARQVHPQVNKTLAITVTYTWRIAVTTTS